MPVEGNPIWCLIDCSSTVKTKNSGSKEQSICLQEWDNRKRSLTGGAWNTYILKCDLKLSQSCLPGMFAIKISFQPIRKIWSLLILWTELRKLRINHKFMNVSVFAIRNLIHSRFQIKVFFFSSIWSFQKLKSHCCCFWSHCFCFYKSD